MIRIVHCAYCGKDVEMECGSERIYCSTECKHAAWNQKKKDTRKAKAAIRALTHLPIDPKKCRKCVYGGGLYKNYPGCNYVFVTGKSRLQLHPEGLGPTCAEYEPKSGRRLCANFSLDGGETTFVQHQYGEEKEQDELARIQRKILAYSHE